MQMGEVEPPPASGHSPQAGRWKSPSRLAAMATPGSWRLHHHRQQTVAAAGVLAADPAGSGCSWRKIAGVDGAKDRQPHQQYAVGPGCRWEIEARDHGPERQGVADPGCGDNRAHGMSLFTSVLVSMAPITVGIMVIPALLGRSQAQLLEEQGEKRHGAAAGRANRFAPRYRWRRWTS